MDQELGLMAPDRGPISTTIGMPRQLQQL